MLTLPETHIIYATAAKAQAVADANTAAEECGWTYTVITLSNGKAAIEIKDEDGFKVGML